MCLPKSKSYKAPVIATAPAEAADVAPMASPEDNTSSSDVSPNVGTRKKLRIDLSSASTGNGLNIPQG
ncbi:hypothetical protein A7981_05645 [Methylovorus sp. MM2]|uniref:hypothetical protein n=1 Tax=Methylovorus sp. MM2 TaxID=1848038 RepID=UPI0007DE856C|nr:hypothetical protein [Methylovorus sp. MM2]OAM52920.1 hypothetical protein A7981_05645 [Methylovorus sp. MM2]